MSFDAIVVPGGGLDENGEPHPWVKARLDAALQPAEQNGEAFVIVLSRGTTHRPPPRDGAGFPVDEASASARYLSDRGVSRDRILLDTWSLDTIGNAFFARTSLCQPLDLRRLLIITNEFHAKRVRAIFEWVFGLSSDGKDEFSLEVRTVPNAGMDAEVAAARTLKEDGAVASLSGTKEKVGGTLRGLVKFLMLDHKAYNAEGACDEARPALSASAAKSY